MRISRVRFALISALAGPVLAMAFTGQPGLAQTVAAGQPLARNASLNSLTSADAPRPPADVPDAPPADSTIAVPSDGADAAAPVVPDAPVASTALPAPAGPAATAADAALTMANIMDGAGGGISNADLMSALESGAEAGQPMALWRLGTMYENGEGVAKDDVKAFGYYSQIANDHADAAPRGVDADIVAQSFVKMGDYYRAGLPDAGVAADPERAEQLILHAATYFGNADAQYRVGELYLRAAPDANPLQGARWLSLAAHKGHVAAQARLGDLLFNGAGIKAQPAEGLMWLSVAHDRSAGTADEQWIGEMLTRDMSVATPDQREEAIRMAAAVEPQFAPVDRRTAGN